jgi:hypothetical protein
MPLHRTPINAPKPRRGNLINRWTHYFRFSVILDLNLYSGPNIISNYIYFWKKNPHATSRLLRAYGSRAGPGGLVRAAAWGPQIRPPPTRVSQLAHKSPHQLLYDVEEREDKERECTISSSRAKLLKKMWEELWNPKHFKQCAMRQSIGEVDFLLSLVWGG